MRICRKTCRFGSVLPGAILALLPMAELAAATDAEVLDCRAIAEADARLACYDRIEISRPPAPEKPLPDDASALFGLPADEAVRQAEIELGREIPDAIESRITWLRVLATGKVEFRLENGQHWIQTDSGTFRARVSDAVKIRRAAFGSYLLQLATGGAGYRVRRIS